MKKEEIIFGKESEEKAEPIVKNNFNIKVPPPMHISHFPEMSYAVLRASNW